MKTTKSLITALVLMLTAMTVNAQCSTGMLLPGVNNPILTPTLQQCGLGCSIANGGTFSLPVGIHNIKVYSFGPVLDLFNIRVIQDCDTVLQDTCLFMQMDAAMNTGTWYEVDIDNSQGNKAIEIRSNTANYLQIELSGSASAPAMPQLYTFSNSCNAVSVSSLVGLDMPMHNDAPVYYQDLTGRRFESIQPNQVMIEMPTGKKVMSLR